MKLELIEFKKENIPELLTFASDSYSQNNPSILKGIKSIKQFNELSIKLINLLIQAAERVNQRRKTHVLYNTFIRMEGKMSNFGFGCDLHELINVVKNLIKFDDFQKLPIQALGKIQPGEAVYNLRGAVKKEYMKQGLFYEHFQARKNHFLEHGIEYSLNWISNPFVTRVLDKGNSKVLLVHNDYGFPFYLYKFWHLPKVIMSSL